ncbi:MAG: hypothetical protein IPP31_15455 [Chitinophagaceae bacterium]|nr:hypothetical protein [Chitinophagaceae bacterium]
MKKYFILLLLILPALAKAQSVSVNTDGSQPDNTAMLDIKSNSKGLLIPRLTTAQRTGIVTPALGLTVFDLDTYTYWIFRGDVNGNWVELLHSLDKHWDRNGNNIFTTNNGNVGIGTNSPADKLTINATDPVISLMNAGTQKGSLKAEGNHLKLGTPNTNATGNLVLNTKGIDRMTLMADGNFGMGISSPVSRFQIVGGYTASLASHGFLMLGAETSTNLVFDNNDIMVRNNGAASNLYLQNAGGNVYIGDATNFSSSHRLGVDGNTVITGNLRVGTTLTPSGYKLAVDGKAICTELMVRLVPNWPDYVFEQKYRLPRLDEVEAFISKNNHLPGIPSAKSIETNGLNVGEMQKMQMEKIEELTLYLIELKKEVEKLKAGK